MGCEHQKRKGVRNANHRVEVRGRVVRDADGRARLMKVASPKLVNAPDDSHQQT